MQTSARRPGDPVLLTLLGIGLGAGAAGWSAAEGVPGWLALALAVLVPWTTGLLLVVVLLSVAVLRRRPQQPLPVPPRRDIDVGAATRLHVPLPRQDRRPLDEARKGSSGAP